MVRKSIGRFWRRAAPYPTLLTENGAQHSAAGPTLGSQRDAEANGIHSATADADGADEDGVVFGTIRVGHLDASVTVNVQNAPQGAELDAWIDFDGDGDWGGPAEHIADSVSIANGNNVLTFDVPSGAADGLTFARFRLSTVGNLGLHGVAADGEVEDYAITIEPPAAANGVFGSQNTITTNSDGARIVHAADVDGDGDMDVLSASFNDDTIAWYENNGAENFVEHEITTTAVRATGLFAADVDGDGDLDVLASSEDDDTVAWYVNDGTPAVGPWTKRVISLTADGPLSVYAGDVDGDGDLDVLSTSINDDVLAWYENDGTPSDGGWTARDIAPTADYPWRVYTADLDGDGDLDVLSASENDDTVAWYENDGTPDNGGWTARDITTAADGATSVYAADLDGDGDLDVLSSSFFGDRIAWYENDGTPAVGMWTARDIAAADGAKEVYVADVDGDGDLDVLSASFYDDAIVWYENDGTPGDGGWSPHSISLSADGAWSVFAADMDGDGDLDVLSASRNDDRIAWYENLDPGPGDYDVDGNVDTDDYNYWKMHFGDTSGPGLTADGSGNTVVDAADYVVWRKVFGNAGAAQRCHRFFRCCR